MNCCFLSITRPVSMVSTIANGSARAITRNAITVTIVSRRSVKFLALPVVHVVSPALLIQRHGLYQRTRPFCLLPGRKSVGPQSLRCTEYLDGARQRGARVLAVMGNLVLTEANVAWATGS
jgi:hypothetical protein